MAKPPLDVEATYTRIIKLIQHSIRVTGWSQVEMDEAIGRPRGYLSHVFHRRIELKVRDFLKVLRALEIDPAQMLGPLVAGYPFGRGPLSQTELLVSMVKALPDPLPPAPPEERTEEEKKTEAERQKMLQQLRPMVSEYLEQFLADNPVRKERIPREFLTEEEVAEVEKAEAEKAEAEGRPSGSTPEPPARE